VRAFDLISQFTKKLVLDEKEKRRQQEQVDFSVVVNLIDVYLAKFNEGSLQYNDAVLMILSAALKGITKDDDEDENNDNDSDEIITETELKIEEKAEKILPYLCNCLMNPPSVPVAYPSVISLPSYQLTSIHFIGRMCAKSCDFLYTALYLPEVMNVFLHCLSLPVPSSQGAEGQKDAAADVVGDIVFHTLHCIYSIVDSVSPADKEDEEDDEDYFGVSPEQATKKLGTAAAPTAKEIKKRQKLEGLNHYLIPLFEKLLGASLRKELVENATSSLSTAQRLVQVGLFIGRVLFLRGMHFVGEILSFLIF
jgi:hypothetical protein